MGNNLRDNLRENKRRKKIPIRLRVRFIIVSLSFLSLSLSIFSSLTKYSCNFSYSSFFCTSKILHKSIRKWITTTTFRSLALRNSKTYPLRHCLKSSDHNLSSIENLHLFAHLEALTDKLANLTVAYKSITIALAHQLRDKPVQSHRFQLQVFLALQIS